MILKAPEGDSNHAELLLSPLRGFVPLVAFLFPWLTPNGPRVVISRSRIVAFRSAKVCVLSRSERRLSTTLGPLGWRQGLCAVAAPRL